MEPIIGSILHVISEEGNHVPAIVLGVNSSGLYLELFGPFERSGKFKTDVQQGTTPGTWHWPEKET